jgi:hypothetical protein
LVEIKAHEKFNRRHMVDIPRIKFFAQRRYRANWPFVDGHELFILAVQGWASLTIVGLQSHLKDHEKHLGI